MYFFNSLVLLLSILNLLLFIDTSETRSSTYSRIVFEKEISSGCNVVIRDGEDVCSLLGKYIDNWATEERKCSSITLKQLKMEVIQELLIQPETLSRIGFTENLFFDCNLNSGLYTCVRQTYMNSWKINRWKILSNLLEILNDRSLPEKIVVDKFIRQYEESSLKFTSVEGIVLFSTAYNAFPNNSILINRFGQSLQLIEQDDLKSSLYEYAVKNGVWPSTIQRPELDYTNGLSAYPWHDSYNFSFAKVLENNYNTFKEELNSLLLLNITTFRTENENLNSFSGGDWTALVIKSSTGYSSLSLHLPRTTEILRSIGEEFLLIKYSALKPGIHILPHTGPSNKRLRAHFCITHTGGAWMRVGEEWRTWQEGKVLVLDSSYEHEVVHNGQDLRVVLILDIWHPEYIS